MSQENLKNMYSSRSLISLTLAYGSVHVQCSLELLTGRSLLYMYTLHVHCMRPFYMVNESFLLINNAVLCHTILPIPESKCLSLSDSKDVLL